MQRLLQRLAWRNLSIQAKVGLLFVLQIGLITLMGLSSFAALRFVQRQTGQTVNTSLEMRTIAQELQIDLDALQRLEQRTVENVGQPQYTFDPLTGRTQHAELVTSMSANLRRLEELSEALPPSEVNRQIGKQIADLRATLEESPEQYDETVGLVNALVQSQTGALVVLEDFGRSLQFWATSEQDSQLVSLVATTRLAERDYRISQDVNSLTFLRGRANDLSVYYETSLAMAGTPPELEAALYRYLTQIEVVINLLKEANLSRDRSQFALDSMRDSTARLTRLTETLAQDSLLSMERANRTANTILLAGVLVAVVLGAGITTLMGRGFARSFGDLITAAAKLESGDFNVRAPIRGDDEFSRLARSFNAMAVQLEGLVSGLEQRVAERTRDLNIVAEVSQAVVAMRDPRDLMNEVVEMIRDRFDFYHAQVFLIDAEGVNAELIASTGAAGRELLTRKHYLPVGSQSVIGQVTAYGEPVIARDTDTSAIHRRNELLPETRSEMALPMRIGQQVIGALDVQSTRPNAFDSENVGVFQLMADQLAIGLENARLFARYNAALEEVQAMSRRQTAQNWEEYRAQRIDSPLRFQLVGDGVTEASGDDPAPTPLEEAIRQGKLIALQDNGGDAISVAVPIRVRGEVIGALGFGGESIGDLTGDDLALVQAVVERVGLALENRRLFEQTQRQARREQLVNEITAKVVGSTDIDHILKTTVEELGRVLRAPQTTVQLKGGGITLDE